ncbi:MAG: SUMF1/EgtB/PvdO family nonheme iron enzyme [Thermoanaerobaculia bacterium]|nr:SUMF1/EgtB/PvdO family nonheme iron enzyme [Thermoanaerobaculia bacterium]
MMGRNGMLISLLAVLPSLALGQTRGAAVSVKALDASAQAGRQVLVLIAINQYKSWTPLSQPAKDAEALRKVLEGRYALDEVITLYDGKATKAGIIGLLGDLQKKLQEEDSLLLFYAGHGHLDEMSGTGFWIPSDAGTDVIAQENWLPNSQIRGLIRNIPSRHVLVVSDSCFSGDLLDVFRGRAPDIKDEYFKKAYSLRARQVLTSGASEAVPDRSEFADQLILALKENRKPYVDPVLLFAELRTGVKKTQPLLGSLQGTNHQEGASFLLFLKDARSPTPAPSVPTPSVGEAVDFGDLQQAAETRRKWQAWQGRMNEAFRMAEGLNGDSGLLATEKAEAWKRFLAAYQEDNPASQEDEALRTKAEEQRQYWSSYRDPAPTPAMVAVARPAAKKQDEAGPAAAGSSYANSIGMEFVWIEPGTFMMGSPSSEAGRDLDETQHRVRITKGFYLGKYEVTQGQWEAVMGNNPSYFKACGKECPVEQVSWEDAQEYIRKLNAREGGSPYRLPTEAEWEYAARAGTATALYTGGLTLREKGTYLGPELDAIAWYRGNCGVDYSGAFELRWLENLANMQYASSQCGTHPVGQKKPNAWGLHDMLGNVWEWVSDWKGEYPSGKQVDPVGPSSGPDRASRGGSWRSNAQRCRTADRGYFRPEGDGSAGFRLLRIVP